MVSLSPASHRRFAQSLRPQLALPGWNFADLEDEALVELMPGAATPPAGPEPEMGSDYDLEEVDLDEFKEIGLEELLAEQAPAVEPEAQRARKQEAPETDGEATFCICISQKWKTRTLHGLGRCYRTPGIHYKDYVESEGQPTPQEYDAICQACWPLEKGKSSLQAVAEPDGEETFSSSSSTEHDAAQEEGPQE